MHLLIDGDILLYAACSAAEEEIQWDDEVHSIHSDYFTARENFLGSLYKIIDLFEVGDTWTCHFSDPRRNFRKDILPTYKGNRKGRKPLCLKALREDMLSKSNFFQNDRGLEADDTIAIAATGGLYDQPVICTIDKDLLYQVPAYRIYNWNTEELIPGFSEKAADEFHLFQTLTGDSVDGYSGCPGVGPKTAEKILEKAETPEEAWALIVNQYATKGLTEEDALAQARVARILRHGEYDTSTNTPILWEPPYGPR